MNHSDAFLFRGIPRTQANNATVHPQSVTSRRVGYQFALTTPRGAGSEEPQNLTTTIGGTASKQSAVDLLFEQALELYAAAFATAC